MYEPDENPFSLSNEEIESIERQIEKEANEAIYEFPKNALRQHLIKEKLNEKTLEFT